MGDTNINKKMASPFEEQIDPDQRYISYFHELDAWTEYWDIYHPETKGHYYFGADDEGTGLLNWFLPRDQRPPAFKAWSDMALLIDSPNSFLREIQAPNVCLAIMEVDELISRIFSKHFGNPSEPSVQADYLNAMFRFATDTLPPAIERNARIADNDPRKSTAGRHTLAGDIMWFAWALHLEASHLIDKLVKDQSRRALMLAGVAIGCAANFTWLGHRRTRSEYRPDAATASLLHDKGICWASDFETASKEVRALYRIREWGEE